MTFTANVSLKAQALFVGTEQQLWVSNGGMLTVHGDLDNAGEITNNGELSVSGNWTMQGEYVEGTGLVVLNGKEGQQIDHDGQRFFQLSIESGGDKSILSNILVSSALYLDSGIIRAENDQQVILAAEAEIFGGNQDSFVEGIVVNSGTGYKLFPVGKDNQYLPVELLDVRGNNPMLSAEVIEPQPQPLDLSGLERVSSQRYWQVNTLMGNYEGSVVRLGIADEPDFSTLSGLVVAAAPQLSSTYISLGAAEVVGTLDEGSITSENPTNLPILTLGLSAEFSEEGEVLVPNAFAPDSPLEEDRNLSIFAVNLAPEDFVFRIFNRWGKLVYETTSLDEALETGWNGINQETNQPAQFGVYSYYLSGKFSDNEPVMKKGTLTLFR
ncbi:T9SS type B sorting domain-containing protein [Catalinimonas niigatensis]|uniref:T9SS type B sorting domain-containing protein n=1 Tax=Catalinimonas niigatensis TaxID=1397264 RepID=UPI00266505B7|nr:gliding motility-associated C-terminal domain-containing protein [Catalinimonas niigatensis]WPP49605.1 gliding motility-associated C-terminal domain-containing protein [Catalinimonas niigatensis]